MDKDTLTRFARENWWQLGAVGVGLVLLVVGAVVAERQTKGEELSIITPTGEEQRAGIHQTSPTNVQVVVDVAGAVEKPAVYRLPAGSRLGEAIIAAGGLAETADRSWVARFMNQAQLITDGMKLYIPAKGENTDQAQQAGSYAHAVTGGQSGVSGLISINSASPTELDRLWGVGVARAQTIIDNRPYGSIEELITKAKLPRDVIEKNKDKLGL